MLDGSRQPLDFRWFVGRRTKVSTADAAWCPIACARPVALKQCLGLPKPLWHEVLELCGGGFASGTRRDSATKAPQAGTATLPDAAGYQPVASSEPAPYCATTLVGTAPVALRPPPSPSKEKDGAGSLEATGW